MAQTLTQRCVHIFIICIHAILLRPNETYIVLTAQWKFSGDKHKSLQVDTERTFHQRYPLAML